MKKTYQIILKVSKYLLIIFLSFSVIASLSFIFFSRKLDYKLPTHTSYDVYDRNGEYFFTISNGSKQSYVTLEEIDIDLINAFISIEDKRFFKHKGVDFIRIGGAIIANLEAKYLKEGASTITQQYVKNLYLTQDKALSRKIQEVMIAINIERNYTKNEILEGYLNSIYFGHGIYGVSDASEFYFQKKCDNLTLSECAILASIPKGPSLYSPILNPVNNLERKKIILKEMYQDGVIKENEYIKALDEETKIYGKVDDLDNSQYYQDIIVSQVSRMDFLSRYNNSKINIYTSFDRNLTNIVNEAIDMYYPYNDSIELSVFAMNPYTKEVLCCIGGKDYAISTYNRATKALRQPGSTIKPFLYYSALENGFTPITTIYSGKTQFNLDGEIYAPKNFANIYPDSDITMAYALATSDNIYALKTHLFLGTDQLTNTLKKLNFTTPIQNNVSLCLGTSEVYMSELVNAYSTIASLGYSGENIYITKITDSENNLIYTNKADNQKILNPTSCYILSETMTNVFDNKLSININVTGYPIINMLTHKYAAKSGSTDYDNWMIGYNQEIVLGVWCGYDDNQIQENSKTKFIKYIWGDVIEKYMKNINGSGWYQTPKNVVGLSINPTTGKIDSQSYQKTMYFCIDNIPWYVFNE